jgi:predicted RNA-binding Zn-ribbon protein involved in translation (DUF1610 family)
MPQTNIRWILSRYDSKCSACCEIIDKGDKVAYDIEEKVVYCPECGEEEQQRQEAKAPAKSELDSLEDRYGE